MCARIAWAAAERKYRKVGDSWVMKESEVRYTDASIYESAFTEAVEVGEFSVREAGDGQKYLEATLIAPGFSKNTVQSRRKTYRRHYGEAILRETAPRLDGMEIYIGYDEHNDPLEYPKEFGVWEASRYEDGRGIRGDVHVYPDQFWVLDRFKVNPNTLKLSIEGNGGYRFGVLEGEPAADVVKLNVERARLVKRPAAGGAITGIRESQQGGERMKLVELTEAERAELKDEARKEVLAEGDVKAKDEKIKQLEEAAEGDKAKIAELEKTINEAKSVELIEAAFPEDLPDCAKDRLREALKGETGDLNLTVEKDRKAYEAKVAEAVKKEAEYVASLAEAGKVKGMGGGAADKKRKTFVEESTKRVLEMAGAKVDEADDKK